MSKKINTEFHLVIITVKSSNALSGEERVRGCS